MYNSITKDIDFSKKEGKTGPITYISPTNQDNVTTPETDPEVIRTFPAAFPGLSGFYPDRGKGFGLDLMSGRTLEQSQFIETNKITELNFYGIT